MFPSLFAIRAAEIEEELSVSPCRYCNSEEGYTHVFIEERIPPLHILKWTRDARLRPQLVFVDVRPLSPPFARIASAPPLMRPSVSERVAEVND